MRQMNLGGLQAVPVDYEAADIPPSVKEFKPAVFKDGPSFCVLLGPDPQTGVFGCGDTTDDALVDWDKHLQERARNPKDGDDLDEYIQDTLAVSDWMGR
jgi:hypothetical protein